jgi:hypothetical protein
MTTSETSTAARTHALGSYAVDGQERELVAVQVPGEQHLTILDVLRSPLPEDGDVDQRQVEQRVGGIEEARGIAADYISLAERIGSPPMPSVWW